jgi:hypothetical protein
MRCGSWKYAEPVVDNPLWVDGVLPYLTSPDIRPARPETIVNFSRSRNAPPNWQSTKTSTAIIANESTNPAVLYGGVRWPRVPGRINAYFLARG